MRLAQYHSTDYNILIHHDATDAELFAAEELAHFLASITGAYFPLVLEDTPQRFARNIIVGHGAQAAAQGVMPDPSLGEEGYELRWLPSGDLVIAGGRPRGTLYGVYALLEEDLGCRWYTPTLQHIPTRDTLDLPDASRRHRPALEYREAYYGNAFDGDWCARNRLNGHFDHLHAKHGGKVKYHETFVHTFDKMVPVDRYFDQHPEYFSLVDGVRLREKTQLCLTNPDVLRLAIDAVRAWIAQDPDATIVSVSQNDWYNPCTCDACRAIDEREGSHSGTLIHFVNQVAAAIAPDYPHITIDTLAYQYTRPAPASLRPLPNVCVRLCTIECCFGHPLRSCDITIPPHEPDAKVGASFQQDLENWSKVCDRLYIWDYVTNFSHYCLPFPNLEAIGPNIQYFLEHNVRGIFEQGNYAVGGGPDFNELRTFLLAKLLWNPNADVRGLTEDFLAAYYGRAALPLLTYLMELHAIVRDSYVHFGLFCHVDIPYLTPALLMRAEQLFDQAEALADDEAILWRVRRTRMSIRFARMAQRVKLGQTDPEEVTTFFADMPTYGLHRVSEWREPEEDMRLILQEGKLRLW